MKTRKTLKKKRTLKNTKKHSLGVTIEGLI